MVFVGVSCVFEVMDFEKEVDDGYVILIYVKYEYKELVEFDELIDIWVWNNKGKLIRLKGDVRLDYVDFGYSSDKLVLKDIFVFVKLG